MARTSGLVTFEEFRAMWDANERLRDDAAAAVSGEGSTRTEAVRSRHRVDESATRTGIAK